MILTRLSYLQDTPKVLLTAVHIAAFCKPFVSAVPTSYGRKADEHEGHKERVLSNQEVILNVQQKDRHERVDGRW